MKLAEKLAAMKAAVNVGGNERMITLGNGNYTLKLRMPEGRVWCTVDENSEDDFYQEYTVDFSNIPNPKYENKGPKTYYAVPAVITESSNSDLVDATKIVYVRFAPSMINMLISKLTMWENLFDEKGNVVNISISQPKGKWTCEMEVHPTKKFDSSECKYPSTSIEDAAKWAAGDASKNGDDKPADAPDVTSFA